MSPRRATPVALLCLLVGCMVPREEAGGFDEGGLLARDGDSVYVGTYFGKCLSGEPSYPRTELLVETFDDDRVAWEIRSADGQPVMSLKVLELGVLPAGFVELHRDEALLQAIADPGFRGSLTIIETVDADGAVINRGAVEVTAGDDDRVMVNTTSIGLDRAFCDGAIPS